jgi:tetratricopeptide (TPR) repeat protein
MSEPVLAWMEKVMIPTYPVGEPEKNPIFLQKRVYQGSSGAVYPHPVIEKISDNRINKEYTAYFLENRYLRIMILPELGGRIQRAYDKIRKRDFIYYNQVIKPALVGLTGPWISGGIEFNWPQHHRPSTFEPVDVNIIENADGSKTVWVNELELMTRTKGMAGFTLYPDNAYLEVKVRLYNRTHFAQSFLWWANPAVKVNEHYQSVFPPDVHAVFDHGKRDVSDFPVATGTYYKVDYSPGTDISRYRNIPVPTSFMAVSSKYDFIGCYEHDSRAGMLHVADHHLVPGKKQWTWGNGDFGKAWDRNLTDEDGPYIELMCGAFTDNQPDFSWLEPGEQKSFEQYFLPYAGIGIVKNATKDAAISLEVEKGRAILGVYVTGQIAGATIELIADGKNIFTEQLSLSPEQVYLKELKLPDVLRYPLKASVRSGDGRSVVEYAIEEAVQPEIPQPAEAAKLPHEIASNEMLFLNGLHLEQYRHATFPPTDYYMEALRRDAGDIRSNNAMGLWLMRRAQFEKAEPYFRAAIITITSRNPNPYTGEAHYNLGLCLKLLGRKEEAYDVLYKSTWNDAQQHSAFFQLSRIACSNGEFNKAIELLERSLVRNAHSHSAIHLKTALLRRIGKLDVALSTVDGAMQIDPFNYGCYFEKYLISGDRSVLAAMTQLMRSQFNNYLEYALDYMHAGLYREAVQLLLLFLESQTTRVEAPLAHYYLAYLMSKCDDNTGVMNQIELAMQCSPDYCFPSRIEDTIVLRFALNVNPRDYKAWYYLGNYWYANEQNEEAITCWESSLDAFGAFPTVHRNLALAYHNKRHEVPTALRFLEKAFELDTSDARVLMELDQLYKLCNKPPQFRLSLLEKYSTLVEQRDDLYLERASLMNQLGRFREAKVLMAQRKFHPWEGGEGKTVAQHAWCHLGLAMEALCKGYFDDCLALLDAAAGYPENLGEGKLPGVQENDINYLRGCCYEKMGMSARATEYFLSATRGVEEPVQAIFYNDPQPDKIVYQGLAWLKLGKKEVANRIFARLVQFGEQHMNDDVRIDYFAVSLPDLLVFDQDLNLKNRIHCIYLKALGNLGLMKFETASRLFEEVLAFNINHQGALIHKQMLRFLQAEPVTA